VDRFIYKFLSCYLFPVSKPTHFNESAHFLTIKMTEVKCLRREAGDSVLEWSCKKNGEHFNICGRCQTCVLSQKLHHYTQWVIKTGGASQRRFLTGIMVRCHNLQILEHLQSVLQVTSGKDFTYSRSRALPIKPEDTIWRMDGAMDTKLHEMGMLETWEWFRESPDSTKSKYVLGLLSLCDTPLLHMLANLVHILIVWEKHKFLQFSNAGKKHITNNDHNKRHHNNHIFKQKKNIFY